jgi:hypothetical protein
MPTAYPWPMTQQQIPDPHAVATDNKNVPTFALFTPPPEQTPSLTSLTPNTAVHGAPTVITIKGARFEPGSKVVTGNFGIESTGRYIDPTTMTFTPWSGSVAGAITVQVMNVNGAVSNSLTLTLT